MNSLFVYGLCILFLMAHIATVFKEGVFPVKRRDRYFATFSDINRVLSPWKKLNMQVLLSKTWSTLINFLQNYLEQRIKSLKR